MKKVIAVLCVVFSMFCSGCASQRQNMSLTENFCFNLLEGHAADWKNAKNIRICSYELEVRDQECYAISATDFSMQDLTGPMKSTIVIECPNEPRNDERTLAPVKEK
jgi:hypothetical protein